MYGFPYGDDCGEDFSDGAESVIDGLDLLVDVADLFPRHTCACGQGYLGTADRCPDCLFPGLAEVAS